MQLRYPGIVVQKTGLTIRIEAIKNGQKSIINRRGHGWLRLVVRATRTPVLQLNVLSNQEARPQNVPDVSLRIQHTFMNIGNDRLDGLNLKLAAPDPASLILTELAVPAGELRDVELRVLRRDKDNAEIKLSGRLTSQPDAVVTIEGHARIIAPDCVVSRASRATENNGWLALSNFPGDSVNGNWDLCDGDLDDLPTSPEVRAVDLEGNAQLSDSGIYPLSQLPNLESVLLSRTGVSGIGMKAFKSLPRFHYIAVHGAPFTDQGLFYLQQCALTGFDGNDTRVTDEGLRCLSSAPLRSLQLSGTDVTDAGFATFSALPRLEILILDRTKISDALMSRLPVLCPNLENLAIANSRVTEASVPFLAALPKLNWIIGGEKAFGTAAADKLRHARPDIRL